jgi:hypothetical protein
VQDDGGAPVAGAYVTCAAPGSPASVSSSRTDGEGRFVLANCPDGTGLTVYASLGNEQTRREGVDPRRGEIELRLPRRPPDLPRSARIIGRVVGPDGQPVADAHVAAYGPRGEGGGHGATQSDGTFALGPVPPGQYGVFVRCARFPIVSVPMRELAADATWDTGLLQLVAGGTGLVQVTDAPAGTDVDFTIRGGEAGRRYAGQWISDGLLRTDALAPGDYRVDLRCDGRAAISVAFAVRAGEETRVEARLQPGVLQRFHFARADGRRPSADLVRSVHRGAELLIDRSFAWWNREPVHAPDGAMTHALWLAPGSYRIDAEDGGAAGSAEFTVGEREGQPVRVVLR